MVNKKAIVAQLKEKLASNDYIKAKGKFAEGLASLLVEVDDKVRAYGDQFGVELTGTLHFHIEIPESGPKAQCVKGSKPRRRQKTTSD